jgi:hypothetical protein
MKELRKNIILEQTKKPIHGPKHHIRYIGVSALIIGIVAGKFIFAKTPANKSKSRSSITINSKRG